MNSEPSSSLDPSAEAELFNSIHRLSGEKGKKTTTIYISHRFSTGELGPTSGVTGTPQADHVGDMANAVRRADKIAVVEGGVRGRIRRSPRRS